MSQDHIPPLHRSAAHRLTHIPELNLGYRLEKSGSYLQLDLRQDETGEESALS